MSDSKELPLVFVVDDETDALEVFQDALSLNFRVKTFNRPEEALEAIQESPPDCLVSDLVMPKMDGVEFVRKIRKTNTALPILVISGYGEKDQIIDLFRMGCFDFLSKPFRYQELSEKITRVLKHGKEIHSRTNLDEASKLIRIEDHQLGLKVSFGKAALLSNKNAQLVRLQLMKAQSAITSALTFDFSEVSEVSTENLIFLKSFFDNLEQDGRRFHWHNISAELDTLLSSQLITYNSAV
ncbi:response regulator [Pseudobacteriovorax antillogorgiicola]|uniref:Response regulator receiver domain-containing protein n=1 Tax=Pseudobacteriovorax antillogorgiicola TaxID=1513793 RepID=A0A1Y6BJ78_9BACT|nr:response regulator [Pseudobacteriovorax antillogorgiicola]TCS56341.1 response regulator receiver domain-containing protein [Pseudobacteriovorax antillogorgiicola]SMF06845.1 Response regulator receiver domain-containing protein [Pseudobacteriovorax antillogorgiicola]